MEGRGGADVLLPRYHGNSSWSDQSIWSFWRRRVVSSLLVVDVIRLMWCRIGSSVSDSRPPAVQIDGTSCRHGIRSCEIVHWIQFNLPVLFGFIIRRWKRADNRIQCLRRSIQSVDRIIAESSAEWQVRWFSYSGSTSTDKEAFHNISLFFFPNFGVSIVIDRPPS